MQSSRAEVRRLDRKIRFASCGVAISVVAAAIAVGCSPVSPDVAPGRGPDVKGRIRHYLENRQAHLLKAYDAEFLAGMIEERQALHKSRGASGSSMDACHFDWSQTLGAEIGA